MICQKKYTIKASDSDSNQRLKTSVMLKLFQEISISHIIKLGIGREKTFDKGLLWIIISSHFQIRRLPKYDETIIIKTSPLTTLHLLFPRKYSIYSLDGEELVSGISMWCLISRKTRQPILPDKHGIVIKGNDFSRKDSIPNRISDKNSVFIEKRKIRYSDLDINGHLNNARYLDWIDDIIQEYFPKDSEYHSFTINYLEEAVMDDIVDIYINKDEKTIIGKKKEKNVFAFSFSK